MINKDLIKNVPNKPGVYLWKDQNGKIIYIGKAKNLKKKDESILQFKYAKFI